jgi:hypothetical protein
MFLALSLPILLVNNSTVIFFPVHRTTGSILNLEQAKQHLRSPIKKLNSTKNFEYEEVTARGKQIIDSDASSIKRLEQISI